jgi:hypothetical protein
VIPRNKIPPRDPSRFPWAHSSPSPFFTLSNTTSGPVADPHSEDHFLTLLASVSSVHALPPAPFHTLFGTVGDGVGQIIEIQEAQIILLRGGTEVGRTPIDSTLRPDQNYELRVRFDHARAATRLYPPEAVPPAISSSKSRRRARASRGSSPSPARRSGACGVARTPPSLHRPF